MIRTLDEGQTNSVWLARLLDSRFLVKLFGGRPSPAAALGANPSFRCLFRPRNPFSLRPLLLNFPRTPAPPLPESLSPLRCTRTKSPARCLPVLAISQNPPSASPSGSLPYR